MSQQATKEKYSIETLRERNVSYDHQHWLTQEDVDMANNYVKLIERTRSEVTPQIGDRLVYVTEHGDYYGHALIDSRSAKEGYLKTLVWDNIPEWAIFSLEYGIDEELFLSDEDKEMITRFIAENFPDGYTMSVDWESYKEFDTNPAFGKACKTYKVTFITES